MNTDDTDKLNDLTRRFVREASQLLGSDLSKVRKEFISLYSYVPECMPKKVLQAYEENGANKGKIPPLFCEVTLYELFGKYEARTILALIRSLGKALGYGDMEMRNMFLEEEQL